MMRVFLLALSVFLSACTFESEQLLLDPSQAERSIANGIDLRIDDHTQYRFEYAGERGYRVRSTIDNTGFDTAYVFPIGRLASGPYPLDLAVALRGEGRWYYAFLFPSEGQWRVISDPREFQGALNLGANCRNFADSQSCRLASREELLRAYRVISSGDRAARAQRGQSARFQSSPAATPQAQTSGFDAWLRSDATAALLLNCAAYHTAGPRFNQAGGDQTFRYVIPEDTRRTVTNGVPGLIIELYSRRGEGGIERARVDQAIGRRADVMVNEYARLDGFPGRHDFHLRNTDDCTTAINAFERARR